MAASIAVVDVEALAGAKKLLMSASCRATWDLPIFLSSSFSACLSEAMSLPLIVLSWASFSFILRVCVAMN